VCWSDAVWRLIRTALALVAGVSLTSCVHLPPPASPAEIQALSAALTSLQPDVRAAEATDVAALAYDYPCQLAAEYRLVRPPLLHNLLINLGLKKRGLCYQWTEDLLAKLQSLPLDSLELHWGVSHWGTIREHNTVVVTARHQPFLAGIVLDPWRRSGVLVWRRVSADSYPWQEGELLAPPPPARVATALATPR